jgi:iodothyronine deiodinase-like protein
VPELNEMYERSRDRVAFYVVYIEEAHPSNAWQLPVNIADDVVLDSPATSEARAQIGEICVTRLGIKLPAVVDGADNAVEVAYTGWPDRLYVIDRQGAIAYKSKPGPFGFHPNEVQETLERLD